MHHAQRHPNPTPQNGIFSSTIATFLIQASLALQSNNIQETVCLLSQLVSPGNSSQSSSQFCPPYPGKPSPALIRSTILFVISFFMAMLIVVACGLIHQWCDEFMKNAYPRIAPHKRGRVRTYLLQGSERFRMMNIMYGVRVGLFVTAIVFSCGVSDYLYSIYPTVGWYSWSCVITAALMYTTFTISSLIIDNCPYSTALTAPFKLYLALVLFSYRLLRRLPPRKQWPSLWHELHPADETHSLAKRTGDLADKLDPKAMEWLFTDDGFSDLDMDTFLKGLPGYVSSPITKAAKATLPKVLTEHSNLQRIKEHLLTCVTATELSEEAREARVSACVDSLQILPLNWKAPSETNTKSNKSHWKIASKVLSQISTDYAGYQRIKRTCAHFASGLSLSKLSLPSGHRRTHSQPASSPCTNSSPRNHLWTIGHTRSRRTLRRSLRKFPARGRPLTTTKDGRFFCITARSST